jgi:hypothetical protein
MTRLLISLSHYPYDWAWMMGQHSLSTTVPMLSIFLDHHQESISINVAIACCFDSDTDPLEV